jgi:hypothetical protein
MKPKKIECNFKMHMDDENNRLLTKLLNHIENTNQKNYDIQKDSLRLISNTILMSKSFQVKSESAKGVTLSSTNSPWPTEIFTNPCLICKYYGHGHKDCENIMKDYQGSCLRCFGYGHIAADCFLKTPRTPPFKENFKEPSVFL